MGPTYNAGIKCVYNSTLTNKQVILSNVNLYPSLGYPLTINIIAQLTFSSDSSTNGYYGFYFQKHGTTDNYTVSLGGANGISTIYPGTSSGNDSYPLFTIINAFNSVSPVMTNYDLSPDSNDFATWMAGDNVSGVDLVLFTQNTVASYNSYCQGNITLRITGPGIYTPNAGGLSTDVNVVSINGKVPFVSTHGSLAVVNSL